MSKVYAYNRMISTETDSPNAAKLRQYFINTLYQGSWRQKVWKAKTMLY